MDTINEEAWAFNFSNHILNRNKKHKKLIDEQMKLQTGNKWSSKSEHRNLNRLPMVY